VFAHRATKDVMRLVLSCSTNGGLYQRTRVTTRCGYVIFRDEKVREGALTLCW
jgi:hypothetical protein